MELILKLQTSSEPELAGSTKIFTQEGGTIGRLPTCVWQLNDVSYSLSREHAKIYTQNGLFYLQDNSTNGVFINDSIMALGQGKSWLLKLNDKVVMGEYTFKVESIQTDEFISLDESIPQLDIPLNPTLPQSDLYDPQDSLSDLLAEENSVLKTDIEHSEHLFSGSDTGDIIAKNSDEFMADLTGDTRFNELQSNQQYFAEGKDSHDMEMGSAFNMPGTIPDNINFMDLNSSDDVNVNISGRGDVEQQNNSDLYNTYEQIKINSQDQKSNDNHQVENNADIEAILLDDAIPELSIAEQLHTQHNENISLTDINDSGSALIQEKSVLDQNMTDSLINQIPDGFIPDISLTEDSSAIKDKTDSLTAEHNVAMIKEPMTAAHQVESTQRLIPDNYVPDISDSSDAENSISYSRAAAGIEEKDINYKNAVRELFITLNINIEQYDSDSLNNLMKRMGNMVKQYTMEHNIDLALELTIDKEKG